MTGSTKRLNQSLSSIAQRRSWVGKASKHLRVKEQLNSSWASYTLIKNTWKRCSMIKVCLCIVCFCICAKDPSRDVTKLSVTAYYIHIHQLPTWQYPQKITLKPQISQIKIRHAPLKNLQYIGSAKAEPQHNGESLYLLLSHFRSYKRQNTHRGETAGCSYKLYLLPWHTYWVLAAA